MDSFETEVVHFEHGFKVSDRGNESLICSQNSLLPKTKQITRPTNQQHQKYIVILTLHHTNYQSKNIAYGSLDT